MWCWHLVTERASSTIRSPCTMRPHPRLFATLTYVLSFTWTFISTRISRVPYPRDAARLKDTIAELRKAPTASPAEIRVREEAIDAAKKPPGRVQVTIDVLELGPIELEVRRSDVNNQLVSFSVIHRTVVRAGQHSDKR